MAKEDQESHCGRSLRHSITMLFPSLLSHSVMPSKSNTRYLVLVAGVVLVLIAVSGWPFARRQFQATGENFPAGDTSGVTAEAIAKGRAVFHGPGNCAVCHGQRLEGGVGPKLVAHTWKDASGGELASIYGVVTHGVSNTAMVAHPGGISDAQAMQVSSYVWAVSHDRATP